MDGNELGRAVRLAVDSSNPVYISAGHRIDLDTAVQIVSKCSRHRIPEPIRQVRYIYILNNLSILLQQPASSRPILNQELLSENYSTSRLLKSPNLCL